MPPPKDPKKLEEYRQKMSKIAKSRGYGKWMRGRSRSLEAIAKSAESLRERYKNPKECEKLSITAKKNGNGKWMKGRPFKDSYDSKAERKGKTYEEIYGKDRADEERKKRSEGNLKRFEGKTRKQRDKHNGDGRYRKWRTSVFERDDYTCQKCGQHGGKLNAHHKKPWSKYKRWRYVKWNGITLCEECHNNEHRRNKKEDK